MASIKITQLPAANFSELTPLDSLVLLDAETNTTKQLSLSDLARYSLESSTTLIKAPVRVATTADIALEGIQTIDCVLVALNDRVLVKDQDNPIYNGIWNVTAGSWIRTSDFDTSNDFIKGTQVYVSEGTVNYSQTYSVSTNNPTIGNPINFVPARANGEQGEQGAKGEAGNYYGFSLIGASTNLADRPTSAAEGAFWGLLGVNTVTLYLYTSSGWFNAGPITSPVDYPTSGTIFVQAYGDDANLGSSHSSAVRSIERAVELATTRNGALTVIELLG